MTRNEARSKRLGAEAVFRSVRKTAFGFGTFLPVLVGTVFALGFALSFLPPESYAKIFPGNPILDPLVGAVVGSVSAGNAMLSFVVGGKLLEAEVSLLAVSAFLDEAPHDTKSAAYRMSQPEQWEGNWYVFPP